MKLIKKYQYGKPILQSDQTQQVPLISLNKNSEAAQKIKQDAINVIRNIRGDTLHYIFKENPRAFNYNKNLMIRGSELLKYPQLYTHMGWVNTKNSNIIPEQYYRIGTNGSLDPTHYVNFNSSDTYEPINDSYIDYVLEQALTNNKNLGQSTEKNKQGSIRQKSNLNINPVFTGFSPGVDAITYDSSKTDEEKLSAMAQSSAPLTAAVGFTNPSTYVFTPLMMYSGYNKLKDAKNWKDYVLGAGEITLGSLPLIRPLQQGYRAIRSVASPKYALSRAINSAPLNHDVLYSSNKDFLPTVYETGIKPTFNATTTVKTNQGLIAYDPAHLQKHFEQDITPEFVKDLVENSSSLSQKGKSRNLADLKGKNNIVLFYPNKDNINFMTASVEVPEQFPHLNFSFSNSLEDNSFLGYPSGVQNYNWVKVGENSFKVPKPLLRVTHGADIDSRPYPLRVVFNGNPFEIEKELHNLRKYTYLNEDVNPDFVLRSAYPTVPFTTSTGVNNTSRVYSGIEVPSYLDFVKRYPNVTWDPANGTSSNLPVKEQWYNTVNGILDDVMSPEYSQHISRELGYKVDPVDIRRTLIRRYTGTIPYERNLNYGDFPLSKAGAHTFQGVDAQQAKAEGLNFFDYLRKYNKINSKYSTEDEFLASLSEDEKLAYKYAKDGEQKVLGVELPNGEYGSLFNTPLEEAYHIQDIGNQYTPWMRTFDEHNEELLKYVQPIVPQLGGKEALPRLRMMQRMYRDYADQLKDYYVGLPEYKIPQQFFTDYLKGDKKLYDYLNLSEYIKENNLSRFDFEIKNGYKRNKALTNAAEHIVYNEGSESQDSSMA